MSSSRYESKEKLQRSGNKTQSSHEVRLNILDHGNPDGIYIGKDYVNLDSLPSFEADLRQLQGHFTDGGLIHLNHCEIGRNYPLLIRPLRLWGVSVIGGTGSQNPVYRINFSNYDQCDPDATRVCQTFRDREIVYTFSRSPYAK